MKTIFITLICLWCAASAFAQGQIGFNTRLLGTLVVPVYMPEPGLVMLQLQGQSPAGTPAGTTVYTGGTIPAASGANFSAQLFGGPLGANDAELAPCFPSTTFRTQTALSGFVVTPATTVAVPGVPIGSQARLQLRVWENRGGTITSWADAIQAIGGGGMMLMLGTSLSFDSLPLGGDTILPPTLVGLTSFSLIATPEPSVIALAVLGVGALVVFRRRKN